MSHRRKRVVYRLTGERNGGMYWQGGGDVRAPPGDSSEVSGVADAVEEKGEKDERYMLSRLW